MPPTLGADSIEYKSAQRILNLLEEVPPPITGLNAALVSTGSPVLGYLAAGVLIGPYALSFIKNVHGTKMIAEFGVVFLLFNIGLEVLSRSKIRQAMSLCISFLQVSANFLSLCLCPAFLRVCGDLLDFCAYLKLLFLDP